MTYNGTLGDVRTLAHEIGHGHVHGLDFLDLGFPELVQLIRQPPVVYLLPVSACL